ncbi:MAG: uncharacterized membrane protein YhaH (DUF805 family) [Candidatus Aldehydirespiratoraceae bacterium]|jgi:uncharacterized membrane protein YhaH (DUF805 family)
MEPFITAFKTAMGRYSDFSGRTSNGGFWRFIAFVFVLPFIGVILASILGTISSALGVILFIAVAIFYLATLIPHLAIAIRRLHDTGKSGWFLLFSLIPIGGSLITLFFLIQPSDEPNKYGAASQD